jgi:hypothetical protein
VTDPKVDLMYGNADFFKTSVGHRPKFAFRTAIGRQNSIVQMQNAHEVVAFDYSSRAFRVYASSIIR